MASQRPPIWQLIRSVVQPLDRQVTYHEIKQLLWSRYPDLNNATINAQLVICSVNARSRIHYPENKKPRLASGRYDFLFTTGRGRVVWYDPEKHGIWEILQRPDGTLFVARRQDAEAVSADGNEDHDESFGAEDETTFALEAHLRDYLAKNPPVLPGETARLKPYVDPDERDGVEYQTDVGPIDLLFLDAEGNFVVVELKLGHGPDKALGQILRYMGWVQTHLANGRKVRGVIVAADISPKLCYAATQVPHVQLLEYSLSVSLRPPALPTGLIAA